MVLTTQRYRREEQRLCRMYERAMQSVAVDDEARDDHRQRYDIQYQREDEEYLPDGYQPCKSMRRGGQ